VKERKKRRVKENKTKEENVEPEPDDLDDAQERECRADGL